MEVNFVYQKNLYGKGEKKMKITEKIFKEINSFVENSMRDNEMLSLSYIKKNEKNEYLFCKFIFVQDIYCNDVSTFKVVSEIMYNLTTKEITTKNIDKNFQYEKSDWDLEQIANEKYYTNLNKIIEEILDKKINITFIDKKTFYDACGSNINAYLYLADFFIKNFTI